MKAEARHRPETAARRPVREVRAQSARRVLEQREIREGVLHPKSRGPAELVDHDRRTRRVRSRVRERLGGRVPLVGIDIHQHDTRAELLGGVRGARPSERRTQHVVSGAYPQHLERQRERRGTAGDRHAMAPSGSIGDRLLEGRHPRSLHQHSRAQHLDERALFFFAGPRTRQRDHARDDISSQRGWPTSRALARERDLRFQQVQALDAVAPVR